MSSFFRSPSKKLFLFVLVTGLTFGSCRIIINCDEGEGQVVEREIRLEPFNAFDLEFPARVFLRQSEEQKVKIKAQANIIDLLNKHVDDGEWEIGFDECVKVENSIEIYIEIPTLKSIEISGSGEIIGKERFESDRLEIEVNGSGEARLNLVAKSITSEINGSGELHLDGEAKDHEVEINGSGDIKALNLKCNQYDIEINGSGDVEINVSETLNVEINGSGDINYSGNPKKIASNINGSGSLNQLNR